MSIGLIIHLLFFVLAFLTAAYLVYATAQKSEGWLKSAGTILAAILAALGGLVLIGHLTAPMTGGRPFGIEMGLEWPGGASTPGTNAPSGGTTTTNAGGAKPGGGGAPSPSGDSGGESGGKP